KYGSLASMEYDLLAMRIYRAAIVKGWKDIEDVFKVAKEKDWGRLYAEISEALGEAAWLMTPSEFEAQMRKFADYVAPKPHYFNVVYEAFRKEAYEQARIAARISLARFPDDKDMKREADYLETLIREKQKK
ncbi:MAG: hypothetical protein N3A38_08135, partial [Planctomycetota bacterium]|nr:hypothetical protein [Planctomycetota bacterium]